MEKIKSPKALYIKIDERIHTEIKALAAYKHITIERWVLQAVVEKLMKDKSYLVNNEIPKQ